MARGTPGIGCASWWSSASRSSPREGGLRTGAPAGFGQTGRDDRRCGARPRRGAVGGDTDAEEARRRRAAETDSAGLWATDLSLDPLRLPEYLTAPLPSYVSFQSALFFHGMISQIPNVIVVPDSRPQSVVCPPSGGRTSGSVRQRPNTVLGSTHSRPGRGARQSNSGWPFSSRSGDVERGAGRMLPSP